MSAILPRDRYVAARDFVESEGRPLEVALLHQGLGEGSPEAVFIALAAFQNDNGGFGHGLEPDTTAPVSTAIATSVGLRLLARAGAAGDHPMVRAALGWLGANIDPAGGVWPIVPREVGEAPHAPWWTWSENLAATWNGFRFNPSAELLQLLYHYADDAPAGLIATAEAAMRRAIADTAVIESAYDLKCATRLAEEPAAPADLREPLMALVLRSIAALDPADPHTSVLELASLADGPIAQLLAPRLDTAAADLIAAQQPDGGWTPFWDWSFVDADAWARAKRDWRAWLTREAIETLRNCGRA